MSASDDALDYTTISFKFYLINLIISKQIITNNSSEAIAENFEVRPRRAYIENYVQLLYRYWAISAFDQSYSALDRFSSILSGLLTST